MLALFALIGLIFVGVSIVKTIKSLFGGGSGSATKKAEDEREAAEIKRKTEAENLKAEQENLQKKQQILQEKQRLEQMKMGLQPNQQQLEQMKKEGLQPNQQQQDVPAMAPKAQNMMAQYTDAQPKVDSPHIQQEAARTEIQNSKAEPESSVTNSADDNDLFEQPQMIQPVMQMQPVMPVVQYPQYPQYIYGDAGLPGMGYNNSPMQIYYPGMPTMAGPPDEPVDVRASEQSNISPVNKSNSMPSQSNNQSNSQSSSLPNQSSVSPNQNEMITLNIYNKPPLQSQSGNSQLRNSAVSKEQPDPNKEKEAEIQKIKRRIEDRNKRIEIEKKNMHYDEKAEMGYTVVFTKEFIELNKENNKDYQLLKKLGVPEYQDKNYNRQDAVINNQMRAQPKLYDEEYKRNGSDNALALAIKKLAAQPNNRKGGGIKELELEKMLKWQQEENAKQNKDQSIQNWGNLKKPNNVQFRTPSDIKSSQAVQKGPSLFFKGSMRIAPASGS